MADEVYEPEFDYVQFGRQILERHVRTARLLLTRTDVVILYKPGNHGVRGLWNRTPYTHIFGNELSMFYVRTHIIFCNELHRRAHWLDLPTIPESVRALDLFHIYTRLPPTPGYRIRLIGTTIIMTRDGHVIN